MEMHFNSDHSLIFKDGYEYCNPATWQYNVNSAELILSIPNMADDHFSLLSKII